MKESGLRLKKKLQSKAGETIAETLVTMIILSLAVLMLAGAVVTTARVNKQAGQYRYLFPDKTNRSKGKHRNQFYESDPFRRECHRRCRRGIKCGNSGAGISVPGKQSGKELYLL